MNIRGGNRVEGYRCGVESCDRWFSNHFGLRRHMRIHFSQKEHKCKFCSKSFRLPQYLREHECIHTGELPLLCGFEGCKEKFRQAGKLALHRRTHQNYITKHYHYTIHPSLRGRRGSVKVLGDHNKLEDFCPNSPSHMPHKTIADHDDLVQILNKNNKRYNPFNDLLPSGSVNPFNPQISAIKLKGILDKKIGKFRLLENFKKILEEDLKQNLKFQRANSNVHKSGETAENIYDQKLKQDQYAKKSTQDPRPYKSQGVAIQEPYSSELEVSSPEESIIEHREKNDGVGENNVKNIDEKNIDEKIINVKDIIENVILEESSEVKSNKSSPITSNSAFCPTSHYVKEPNSIPPSDIKSPPKEELEDITQESKLTYVTCHKFNDGIYYLPYGFPNYNGKQVTAFVPPETNLKLYPFLSSTHQYFSSPTIPISKMTYIYYTLNPPHTINSHSK